MEFDDSEAAAAAALLLIVEQGCKGLKREHSAVAPTFERVQARSDAFGEKDSPLRNAANSDGVKVRKAGSRQKLPKTSQAIVVAWLEAHKDYPYPSKQEKDELARDTGLTVKQVSDFTGNWRKRKWKAPISLDQMLDDEYGDGVMYHSE